VISASNLPKIGMSSFTPKPYEQVLNSGSEVSFCMDLWTSWLLRIQTSHKWISDQYHREGKSRSTFQTLTLRSRPLWPYLWNGSAFRLGKTHLGPNRCFCTSMVENDLFLESPNLLVGNLNLLVGNPNFVVENRNLFVGNGFDDSEIKWLPSK
jgi:hypothetical protein